ncbi:slit homolog 2 protein-like [Mytilus californianus]|uniref:slit homolog 2 protein-like n=1 Tax=Mytilus californianus TaxID=6549 RepID=UPI002245FB39|nr:slit homolog 2 protein-like [Mytilus californianus]
MITSVENRILDGLSSLILLDLADNSISSIADSPFIELTNLQILFIQRNRITSVENGSLYGLSSLRELHSQSNRITSVERGSLDGLSSLQKLYLGYNMITSIEKGFLDGLSSLDTFYLTANQITSVENGSLYGLSSLKKLYLNRNRITSVENGSLDGLSSLEILDISGNRITSVEKGYLDGLSSLLNLNLQGNVITSVESGSLDGLSSLKKLDLRDNQKTLECCGVQGFITWIQNKGSVDILGKCNHQSQSTFIKAFNVSECLPPVDGGWTSFGPWDVCSKTCGGGVQFRTRTCTNPPPAHGGDKCPENSQETRSCEEKKCSVDGGWTSFGPWKVCSKTCGGGVQYRTRTCTNPPPAHGGDKCPENSQETRSCEEQQCPVDGGWTSFGPWKVCSKTCGGGVQYRTRTCTNPPPAHGGDKCPENSQETTSCEEQQCPVDGGWTSFGPWKVCSKTCGGGVQYRTRTCTNPPPAHGGDKCPENSQETRSCEEQQCPVHGNWTDFGPWGVCSKTCGLGEQLKTRTCTNPSPAFGGDKCQGSNQMTGSCEIQKCPDTRKCWEKRTGKWHKHPFNFHNRQTIMRHFIPLSDFYGRDIFYIIGNSHINEI